MFHKVEVGRNAKRKQEGISSRFTAVLCLLEVICIIERKNS